MKTKFPGYYSTPEESLSNLWSSESTLFVFDTNCLLNLYRCEEQTREDILNVMQAIANRIWIPFQVGLEFQKNRRVIINSSIESLENIREALRNIYTQNMLDHGKVKRALYNNLNESISKLQKSLKKPIESFIESEISTRIKSKEAISSHDSIRDAIDKIIGDKVGNIPTQAIIDEIDKEGERRYSNKIPPGFKDSSKKDITYHSGISFQDRFGDLYLWKELINKAGDKNIQNIFFISDDTKDDWLFKYKNTVHGPLESLKTEICQQSSIEHFRLINQFTFLNEAKKFLDDINVSDESLEEIEKISLRNSNPESHLDTFQYNEKSSFKWSVHASIKDFFGANSEEVRIRYRKEHLIFQAHEQLEIFEKLADKTLLLLNDILGLEEVSNMEVRKKYKKIYESLSSSLHIARGYADDLSELIKDNGEAQQIITSTIKLRQQCDLLDQGVINMLNYLESEFR